MKLAISDRNKGYLLSLFHTEINTLDFYSLDKMQRL